MRHTFFSKNCQGLIHKEKLHIGCKKGAQIRILANKITTQWWFKITIKTSTQTIHQYADVENSLYQTLTAPIQKSIHLLKCMWFEFWMTEIIVLHRHYFKVLDLTNTNLLSPEILNAYLRKKTRNINIPTKTLLLKLRNFCKLSTFSQHQTW